MTDAELTAVIQGLHPDLKVGEMELRVARAVAEAERRRCAAVMMGVAEAENLAARLALQAERDRCARIAEIPLMSPKDIARVIRDDKYH